MRRPQMFLEERRCTDYVDTTIRIFYPNGTSEFLNLHKYYDNGNVLINVAGEWDNSVGDDWHPDELYEYHSYSAGLTATFLGYL